MESQKDKDQQFEQSSSTSKAFESNEFLFGAANENKEKVETNKQKRKLSSIQVTGVLNNDKDLLESAGLDGEELLKPHDRLLPIANVSRIMKNSLPENAKLAKEAKECVQECVSEFISFVISEAADICIRGKRKLINGEDVLYALKALGFDNYFEIMKLYLHRYRELGRSDEINHINSETLDQVNETLMMNQHNSGV